MAKNNSRLYSLVFGHFGFRASRVALLSLSFACRSPNDSSQATSGECADDQPAHSWTNFTVDPHDHHQCMHRAPTFRSQLVLPLFTWIPAHPIHCLAKPGRAEPRKSCNRLLEELDQTSQPAPGQSGACYVPSYRPGGLSSQPAISFPPHFRSESSLAPGTNRPRLRLQRRVAPCERPGRNGLCVRPRVVDTRVRSCWFRTSSFSLPLCKTSQNLGPRGARTLDRSDSSEPMLPTPEITPGLQL